ncbi:MAG TPA: hypothetical protein VGX78_09165 [Pirellulales bacterium]|jgi:zona occludens toxin (predicted ATPase)|nr:hypothetical protein [Pirellulales bacterium]
MKRFALIATLLGAFLASAAAPASAGVFVYRRPVTPVRTAVRVAAPPYRPYLGRRVYAGPRYVGPGWGYGPGVGVGIGVY